MLPETIDEYVSEENPVRVIDGVIDAFVGALDIASLGFEVAPKATGRPGYHPVTMLKIYVYGYLNRIQSSRRLEQEARRNLELMWLVGRLAPDFKTIADFRAENTAAIKNVCREFIVLCRRWNLFSEATVAIDGSKFKAVNHRDRNFTSGKMATRMALIEQSIAEYVEQLDRVDRCETTSTRKQTVRLKERIATLEDEMSRLKGLKVRMEATSNGQVSLTDPDSRSMASQGKGTGIVGYNVQTAVETQHHLIVAHEVTNVGSDRRQLKRMSEAAREALGSIELTALTMSGFEPVSPKRIDPKVTPAPTGEVRHGRRGGQPDVRLLGGYFVFDSPDAGLLVSLLPALVHVRGVERLSVLVRLVGEESSERRSGRDLVLTRLVELLLIEALRSTSGEDAPPGLLRGLADAQLAPALRQMHGQLARSWTVAQLARKAALSRSAFFERFARTVGLAPMEYLLAWRMAVAKDLLRRHDVELVEVAERVGYGSASTFSTAFSRHVGQSPSRYARER